MGKKLICFLAVAVLAICLLSGGCSPQNTSKISEWKDLLKIVPEKDGDKDSVLLPPASIPAGAESISVELYFPGPDQTSLAVEKRTITKVEGIARKTMEELLKGPQNKDYLPVAPAQTRLLDINIKPDGLCIVDLSSEARQVQNENQAEMMIQAIANTLGQFPTVKRVDFMIDGTKVDSIGRYVNLTYSVEPDYSR